jgi:acetyl-CoA carboxylase carboxyltransferase component
MALMEVAAMTAIEERMPLVFVMNSTGPTSAKASRRCTGGVASPLLLTRARVSCPTFAILDGPAVSGPALLLGLMDFVIVTDRRSYAFVNGTGDGEAVHRHRDLETTSSAAPASLAKHAGLPALVADRRAGWRLDRGAARLLPEPRRRGTAALADQRSVRPPCPEAGELIPESSTGSYDVRQVAEAIVDDGSLLEVRARWAGNVVTAFAHSTGVRSASSPTSR